MDTKRWQLLKDIIDSASHLPPSARAAYLREACAGDAALLAEAESLLGADEQAERLVERAVEAVVEAWVDESSPVGRRLGAYEVVRELGHGGMGSAYLAARMNGLCRFNSKGRLQRAVRNLQDHQLPNRVQGVSRGVPRLDVHLHGLRAARA